MKYDKGSFITISNLGRLKGLHYGIQCVYFWIVTYADGNGICFPSRATLAKDCSMDVKTVDRSIKALEKLGLIKKRARKKDESRNLSNEYNIMLFSAAKGVGTPGTLGTREDVGTPADRGRDKGGAQGRDTSGAVTKPIELNPLKIAPEDGADIFSKEIKRDTEDPTPFTLQQFVESMRASPKKSLRIIGEYADTKGFNHETKGQWNSLIDRNIKVAKRMAPFSQEQIEAAYAVLESKLKIPQNPKGFIDKWTLETLEKYLEK